MSLIIPDLDAASIAFQLVKVAADAAPVGPILLGAARPAHYTNAVRHRGASSIWLRLLRQKHRPANWPTPRRTFYR